MTPNVAPIQVNATLSIKEVRFISFQLTDYAKSNKEIIPTEKFEFELNLQTGLDEKEKLLSFNLSGKLFAKNENIKYQLAELKSLTTFFILNFDEVAVRNPPQMVGMPNAIMNVCCSIAISTLRGMYAVQLQPTIYSNAIVPVIDPSLLLPRPFPAL